MRNVFTPAIAVSLLLCATFLTAAQAQTATPRPVTRDELRVCMNSEGDLAAQRQALEARGKRNGEEAASLRVESAELAEENKTLRERQAPMDRFERKVRTHNVRVKTAQAAVASLRAELEALNQSLQTYNNSCGLISFSAEDKEAILKEREAARK